MTRTKKASVRRVAGLLLPLLLPLLFAPEALVGQVIPALEQPAAVSVFGQYSYGHPDSGKDAIYGYTLGGILQTSHIIGFVIRGSALRYGGLDHQYSALAGIRAGMHFSRFSPYVAALGGAGHARWDSEVNGRIVPNKTGIGPEWSFLGGTDMYVGHRFSIRLGEMSYSKIYVLQHGLTALSYSTGIVYRLPFWR